MKKLLLSVLSLVGFTAFGTGLTIEKADLKWNAGNKWYMAVTAGQPIGSFVSTGTSVTWDLTAFEAGLGKDTVVASTPIGGLGYEININSTLIPETNYSGTASDYAVQTINYDNVNYPMDGPLTIGLSHSSGATWSGNTTVGGSPFAPASVSGSVLAEGTIVTSWGNFAAVLVKEEYTILTEVITYYYWETKEYGRIAYIINGSISLMVGNNFNAPTSTNEVEVSNFNVYPNPSTDQFTVSADNIETVRVFDAIGNLIVSKNVQANSTVVNASGLNAGLYFVQVGSKNATSTKSVVIK